MIWESVRLAIQKNERLVRSNVRIALQGKADKLSCYPATKPYATQANGAVLDSVWSLRDGKRVLLVSSAWGRQMQPAAYCQRLTEACLGPLKDKRIGRCHAA